MILSFHPCIEIGNQSLIHAQQLTPEQINLIKKANIIILPQGITPEIYLCCRAYCKHVFPNYDHRFPGEGKVGDTILWQHFQMPHPRTQIFGTVQHFMKQHFEAHQPLPFDYPFVLKANQGGEGNMVFFIENETMLEDTVNILKSTEKYVKYPGMILQEFVHTGGKDLRVIIINRKRFYFWRIQTNPTEWKTNVSRGAKIDFNVDSRTVEKVSHYLEPFLEKTGINLAAIDVLFKDNMPLFLEINYYFGRRALGGSENFYSILKKEVKNWINKLKIKNT